MPESSSANRRSVWNLFNIEQSFQQRQIVRLLALTGLNVVISTGAFVAFHSYELTGHANPGLPLYETPTPSLLRIAIVWAALMAGLGGLFALLTGLLMTHRMAGPIHKFKNELQRIEAGQAPRPIRLRQGDEFVDMAEALNGALEALWTRSGSPGAEGALALDLEATRALHGEILDAFAEIDVDDLADTDPARLRAWHERMLALREKLDA